jgi:Kef-type K+ transport system membrane component KefB
MIEFLQDLADNPFMEFALIFLFAAILGGVGQFLKQPLIVMFIFLGIILGPSFLDIVQSKENIHLLAEIGIAILLFIVGLKLDLRLIQSTGKIALLTGLGQVLFTSLFGYLIGLALGFGNLESFYIAVALTFSSTIIIVKLLSDKKEIDSLHGQIAIGFLIVQDLVVILVMIVLATIGREGDGSVIEEVGKTLLYSVIFVGFTFLMMRYLIPRVSHFLARSPELLTLFAIAWAVALAAVGELIGFSGEVGAFLAGVSLASSPFKDLVSGRLTSLRDFLLLFFFVNLGSDLDFSVIGEQVPSALIFSFFVLIGNPIIVLIIMGFMGYKKRTGFLAGLTVAQISEFSLIFAGLGLSVGHINDEILGLITLVGLITIALSTYLILYSHQIYNLIAPALSIFEREKLNANENQDVKKGKEYHTIVIGLGRLGSEITKRIENERENCNYFGVDFDPNVVKKYKENGRDVIYADIEDPDLLSQIPFENAKCIINTVPVPESAKHLLLKLQRSEYKGKLYLTAINSIDKSYLNDLGAETVLMPHQLAAANFYNEYLKPELDD